MSAIASKIRDANVRLIEEGNVEKISDYFDATYTVNFGGSRRHGYGAARGFTKSIHEAFSELRVDVKIFVESDDHISWQRTIRGTQTGKFHGFPASGLEVTWRDMVVSRIEAGKIKEEWVVSDLAEGLLRSRKR